MNAIGKSVIQHAADSLKMKKAIVELKKNKRKGKQDFLQFKVGLFSSFKNYKGKTETMIDFLDYIERKSKGKCPPIGRDEYYTDRFGAQKYRIRGIVSE